MHKILKNKESKEMGIENLKGLEKDEDQRALEKDLEDEAKII